MKYTATERISFGFVDPRSLFQMPAIRPVTTLTERAWFGGVEHVWNGREWEIAAGARK